METSSLPTSSWREVSTTGVEPALGHVVGHAYRVGQRADDGAGNGHAQRDRQAEDQQQADDHRGHRLLVHAVGIGDHLAQFLLVVPGHLLELVEQLAADLARLVVGNRAGSGKVVGGNGFGNAVVRGEIGRAQGLHVLVHRLFLGRVLAGDVVVGLLGGFDHAAHIGQALAVVGQPLLVALEVELGLLEGAELAELGAHFPQMLHGGHPVGIDLLHAYVGKLHAPQRKHAQHYRQCAGAGKGQQQLAGDGQVLEPLHDASPKARDNTPAPCPGIRGRAAVAGAAAEAQKRTRRWMS
jgi:hypothetical protein